MSRLPLPYVPLAGSLTLVLAACISGGPTEWSCEEENACHESPDPTACRAECNEVDRPEQLCAETCSDALPFPSFPWTPEAQSWTDDCVLLCLEDCVATCDDGPAGDACVVECTAAALDAADAGQDAGPDTIDGIDATDVIDSSEPVGDVADAEPADVTDAVIADVDSADASDADADAGDGSGDVIADVACGSALACFGACSAAEPEADCSERCAAGVSADHLAAYSAVTACIDESGCGAPAGLSCAEYECATEVAACPCVAACDGACGIENACGSWCECAPGSRCVDAICEPITNAPCWAVRNCASDAGCAETDLECAAGCLASGDEEARTLWTTAVECLVSNACTSGTILSACPACLGAWDACTNDVP